jgi:hypothetical protein
VWWLSFAVLNIVESLAFGFQLQHVPHSSYGRDYLLLRVVTADLQDRVVHCFHHFSLCRGGFDTIPASCGPADVELLSLLVATLR